MSWYLKTGESSDVVIMSKTKIIRNFKNEIYNKNLNNKNVYELLKNNYKKLGDEYNFIDISSIAELDKNILIEKRIGKKENFNNKNNSGLIISNDEKIAIYVNTNTNHIEVNVFSSGLDLENTTKIAMDIVSKIEKIKKFDYSEKYGYLSSNLEEIGTGLKQNLILHLPGAKISSSINDLVNLSSSLGHKMIDIGNDLYELTSTKTLGITELEIIKNTKNLAMNIVEKERKLRKIHLKTSVNLEDIIMKNYGILKYGKRFSDEEIFKILSMVKLGVDFGIVDINDSKMQELFLYMKKNSLQKRIKENLTKDEIEIMRAKVINEIINGR